VSATSSEPYPETADIETASEAYASRFAGSTGAWFLAEQANRVVKGLEGLSPGTDIWDIGGGHAQTAPVAAEQGYSVTVTGSDPVCAARLPDGMRFEQANHLALPLEDQQVEATLCFRLLPHCDQWQALIRELCRVSKKRVIVDYPTGQSLNALADMLFGMKKSVEKNTRPFTLFPHREIQAAFEQEGFRVKTRFPQFFWPMVVHRMLKTPAVSRVLEAPFRWVGLTRLFGSPVVLVAERSK